MIRFFFSYKLTKRIQWFVSSLMRMYAIYNFESMVKIIGLLNAGYYKGARENCKSKES